MKAARSLRACAGRRPFLMAVFFMNYFGVVDFFPVVFCFIIKLMGKMRMLFRHDVSFCKGIFFISQHNVRQLEIQWRVPAFLHPKRGRATTGMAGKSPQGVLL